MKDWKYNQNEMADEMEKLKQKSFDVAAPRQTTPMRSPIKMLDDDFDLGKAKGFRPYQRRG